MCLHKRKTKQFLECQFTKILLLFLRIFVVIFRSLHEMMIAPSENLSCRVYNVAAMSFTPDVLYKAVQKHVPNLEIKYNVDDRQKIGETISKKKSF